MQERQECRTDYVELVQCPPSFFVFFRFLAGVITRLCNGCRFAAIQDAQATGRERVLLACRFQQISASRRGRSSSPLRNASFLCSFSWNQSYVFVKRHCVSWSH